MNAVGTMMGALTLPMAILTMASPLGGAMLLAGGRWSEVVVGIVLVLLVGVMARALERLVIASDDAAAQALQHKRRRLAYRYAILSGAVPVAVLLGSEAACFEGLAGHARNLGDAPSWLWAYGVATAPWTLFALRVSRFRRTLVGIRAYAGHLALWLYGIVVLLGGAPLLGGAAMLLPAVLPFTVGLLLALADRDAITNVRV